MNNVESPIVVTGLGRSGTTWTQWFLSHHPCVAIAGQTPQVPRRAVQLVIKLLVGDLRQAMAWTERANRDVGYPVPHYAGCTVQEYRRRTAEFLAGILTGHGPRRARWGLKELDSPAEPAWRARWLWLFPRTRWILCVRDAFAAIESARNTFVPDANIERWLRTWVDFATWARRDDSVFLWRLSTVPNSPEARTEATRALLDHCGLHHTPETLDFVRWWPLVHKVIPDHARRFKFSTRDKRQWLERLPALRLAYRDLGLPLPIEEGAQD